MSGGVDGTIRIDTRINEKGFNQGVGEIVGSLKGILSKLATGLAVVGLVAVGIVAVITTIATAIIGLGIAAFKFLEKVTMDMYRALSPASDYFDKVTALKTAFDALSGSVQSVFASLLMAAAPVLMSIIDWLIKILNYVSMFLAALSGQTTYMKYISGAAQRTAKGTGQAAKNTEKIEKAAKGALAAFDELNVLQMEQPTQDTGGTGAGGNIMFETTPIENSVLETVDKIKAWFAGALLWIAGALMTVRGWIKDALVWFIETWVAIGEGLKTAFSVAWDFIVNVVFARAWGFLVSFYEFITGIWQAIHDWIVAKFTEAFNKTMENIAALLLFINNFRDKVTAIWQGIHDWIVAKWQEAVQKTMENIAAFLLFINNFRDGVTQIFQKIHDWIVEKFQAAKDKAVEIWGAVSLWFTTNVTDPVKAAFKTVLDWIGETFGTVFEGVKTTAKNAINGIIGFINGMIRAIASGINTIIDGLNKIKIKIPDLAIFGDYAGMEFGFKIGNINPPQIPLLAQGAVIPPNAQFAAILGDQRNGRNLEAPEGLIRQIIREEIGGGDITVTMPIYLDSEKIYEGQKRVTRRRGMSLVNGVTG